MQPVADLQLLQVAEMGVELAERGVWPSSAAAMPQSLSKPAAARELQDLLAQQTCSGAGSRPDGLVIFVDQPLEIRERAVGLGARQRRRQMIDDDGRGCGAWPALPSPGSLTMKG